MQGQVPTGVVASSGAAPKDVSPEMFNEESGNHVEECKLKFTYVPPPQPPSPVREGSDEGSSPRASISENGTVNRGEHTTVKSLISKLTEEKISAIRQNNKLRQELELLRGECNKSRSGIPLIYIVIVGVLGLVLGYLLKRT